MTVEEALAASVVEPVNDIFEIDPETRVITVPASEKLFGVADMIPVKKSDGTLCLYDKVRKKYIYNAGTGTLKEG